MRQFMTLASTEPDEGHAIGHDEIGCAQDLPEGEIVLRLNDAIHTCRRDRVTCRLFLDPFFDLSNHVGDLHRAYGNSKNPE